MDDRHTLERYILEQWNGMTPEAAASTVLPCCGSREWARRMVQARPLTSRADLLHAAKPNWRALSNEDRQEAFRSHPRIGEREVAAATAQSLAWSRREQQPAMESDAETRAALQAINQAYESRFGRVFLIRASGRSAAEILAEAQRRLKNDDAAELAEAAAEQEQITALRLQRWMEGS